MRKTILSLSAVAVLFGLACVAAAAEMKPVVTVSFAGYDKLMSNVGVFGRMGGNPEAAKGIEFMLQMMTGGKGLVGLDKSKPWGAAVSLNEMGQPTFYGFIPVTDLKQLVELAKTMPPLAEKIKPNGEVYEIDSGAKPLFMQQKGNWAVLTDSRENLANAPADPLTLLGEMPKRYDLAVRVSLDNLPPALREQAMMMMQAGAEAGMMQKPGESDDQFALRAATAKQTIEQITEVINSLDSLMLGLNVETSSGATYLDFEMTAKGGTNLADQFALVKPGKSNFRGFAMPDAALSAIGLGTYTDADVARAKNMLETLRNSFVTNMENQGLSEDEVKLATRLMGDLFDVFEKTVESKKKDNALSIILAPDKAAMVFGANVVEGNKLNAMLKDLVDELKKSEPDEAAKIKLNAETYQGVQIHVFSMPTPDQKLAELVGDQLEIVLGVADDKLVAAVGRDALAMLKKALDQSKADAGKEVAPFEMKVSVGKIAKFIAAVADEEQVKSGAAAFAAALESAAGQDGVLVTAKPIAQGVRLRLELEQGLLKALSSMGQKAAPMGGMPPQGGNF